MPAATGPDFQGAGTAQSVYHSRHGTCALTKRLSQHRPTTTQGAGMIIMKSPFGVRLWLLIAALFLAVGGIICGLAYVLHRIARLEDRLTSPNLEGFRIASEIRYELANLNNSMFRYILVEDPQQWVQFEGTSGKLGHWIDDHDPNLNPASPLTSDLERKACRELNRAYAEYVATARNVHSNAPSALGTTAGRLAQLDAFEIQVQRMSDAVQKVADARHAAGAAFLANAHASLSNLRLILIACVVMMVGLVVVIGWVIYRDSIAPLRTKLVLSQTLHERQQKLATLGTLAAGIAHEIRNPLTSLKARLHTLEKHLLIVPAARKDTNIISAEISRLERIVQDILSFARPSDPRLETFPAETVIREVRGLVSPDLERRGLQLVVESSPELFIRADSGHLKQVLINLVRNAAEAIDGEGTVTLRTRAARAPLGGRETDAVILEVSDTGKGIPPEAEKRLFDPFFSTKETGTGLGLTIAARIVEKHGGVLQYQTQPGHGTTFGVVLPREINHIARKERNGAPDVQRYP